MKLASKYSFKNYIYIYIYTKITDWKNPTKFEKKLAEKLIKRNTDSAFSINWIVVSASVFVIFYTHTQTHRHTHTHTHTYIYICI